MMLKNNSNSLLDHFHLVLFEEATSDSDGRETPASQVGYFLCFSRTSPPNLGICGHCERFAHA